MNMNGLEFCGRNWDKLTFRPLVQCVGKMKKMMFMYFTDFCFYFVYTSPFVVQFKL